MRRASPGQRSDGQRRLALLLALLLCASVLGLPGCTIKGQQVHAPEPTMVEPDETEDPTAPIAGLDPGITATDPGKVQAVGTVRRVRAGKTFAWVLVRSSTSASVASSNVVVVVLNSGKLGLAAFNGKSVAVNGALVTPTITSPIKLRPQMNGTEVFEPH
jgi:hypothetical protein